MTTELTERDPLLPKDVDKTSEEKHPLGPLEISPSTRYGILAGIWTATFLSSVNMTLVPTMLPSISSNFHKSHQASWLGTSYLLATCTFTPLYGRLCNVMGRRGANQTAVLFAGLGTLACGLSTNMETLILARFISGMGGGGIFTTSTIVISDMYTLRVGFEDLVSSISLTVIQSRGLTQGVASVFSGLGMGLGGPIGGLVTDWLGWRWAFLIQIPLFALSFVLTSHNLRYVTSGRGKSTKDILKRIDYAGSLALLISVGSCLFFLSTRYNVILPWSHPTVLIPLILSITFFIAFIFVELRVAREPVLAPFLLKQRIPVLVGCSNFLVALCNFSVTFFFPMWFQTVLLTSASVAGLHLAPNSVSMSAGSVFAGWMMHRTGKYKMINLICGLFPFIATLLILQMKEDSGPIQSWLSIVRRNGCLPISLAVLCGLTFTTLRVFICHLDPSWIRKCRCSSNHAKYDEASYRYLTQHLFILVALLAHLPDSHMAVGTGFGQVFRGIGQVGGVAISSAIFQTKLDGELRKRFDGLDAERWVKSIRQSARLIHDLPPDLQRKARDSYSASLKAVFFFSACCTLLAFIVRLPIPEKDLDSRPTSHAPAAGASRDETAIEEGSGDEEPPTIKKGVRRLSTFESAVGSMDLESNTIGGSARQPPPP
ncbi:MFS general substrate transporter [Guyanagaster necrorhizus]|uniref:MFS general substrate transporter n=1 Tax=Guyanagaster necrorhizus TaxID=856835 RepID=A0A9P7W5T4_9AGAR|nr:MFS general substrate transporter [Guyanagaster necrorhizus MCA 3950]KAG7453193.1 MFS general substrate transporter [Guyanagaster necrorhizus MCA 3950]